MKDITINRYGRTYKLVITKYGRRFVLVEKPRPTGPMFIEGNKLYVAPDATIEYMYVQDNKLTLICSMELKMMIAVKGSRYNFHLENINGRMYKVYELM